MKLLMENWRKHLSEIPTEEELAKVNKVRELLCQAVEELFGEGTSTGGSIVIEIEGDKTEFVIGPRAKDGRPCVFPYTHGSELDVRTAQGLRADPETGDPTGMPVEEEQEK